MDIGTLIREFVFYFLTRKIFFFLQNFPKFFNPGQVGRIQDIE